MSDASGELYVYGVVAARTAPPDGTGVGEPGAPLRTIEDGGLAALVSDVPAGPLEAGREDGLQLGLAVAVLVAQQQNLTQPWRGEEDVAIGGRGHPARIGAGDGAADACRRPGCADRVDGRDRGAPDRGARMTERLDQAVDR